MGAQGLMAMGPPAQFSWLLFVRIGILVLSFGVFVAACVNIAELNNLTRGFVTTNGGPGGLAIFTCIWTWIVIGLDMAFGMKFHHLYHRMVFVILYPLTIIFWLSTWAYAASVAGVAFIPSMIGGTWAAIAALGAFTWVAIIVLFVFFILACLKTTDGNAAGNAELGQVKQDQGTAQPFVAQQPQQQYGQPQAQPYGAPAGYPQQQPYGQPTYGQ